MSRSRSARSLSVHQIRAMADFGLHTGFTEVAYLGDAQGVIFVPPPDGDTSTAHYGHYYIRKQQGLDAQGNPVLSQAIPALNTVPNLPLKAGFPVRVRQNPATLGYVIVEIAYQAANGAGYDTRQLNLADPVHKIIRKRQIFDLKPTAIGQAPTSRETRVPIQPYPLVWDGALVDLGKPLANGVDLASSIPAAGLERLVLLGSRPTDQTVQAVIGNTRTIAPSDYSISDVSALVAQLDDYVMPLATYRLSDAQPAVRESDLEHDIRQLWHVQPPRGMPITLSRHFLVLDNYRITTSGSHTTAAGGQYEYQATGQIVSLAA